ncbi:MAG: cytochrome C biogenesis protein [Candidatus Harrisonbacteria bacterium]|nr:cytochrome C biogenesis protein [Candidatus Harrisonbacteria bacterium]
MTSKIRNGLIIFSFLLLSTTIIGIFWLVTTPGAQAGLIFSYAAGLSMIFLPCTLPLVFVIIPLAMRQSPVKGLTMAILFGLGLAITLSIYGAAVAWFGQYIGMNTLIRFMFGIAGAMAFVFGLSELRLLTVRLPFMAKVLPTSLQKSGDYSKSFFMGLFLGNAGVGCPNPAFYVLLTYIATVGNVGDGITLGVIHGLGRATPLIFLTILAILGINTIDWVSRQQEKIDRAMGWGLVGIGAYLFQYLPFKMAFWEDSIFHVAWNNLLTKTLPSIAESAEIEELLNIQGGTATILPWVLIGLMVGAVIIWDAFVQRKKLTQVQSL